MKNSFLIFSVLAVFFQLGEALVESEISTALNECVDKNKLEKQDVLAKLNENVITEDDNEFTTFFTCFAQTLKTVDENGDIDAERLIEVLQKMLVKKLGTVPDVEAKALHIATKSVEHCKDTPKGDTPGLSAIKMRNCIKAFVGEPQQH